MADPTNGNNNQNNRKNMLRGLAAVTMLAVILGAAYWFFFKYNHVSTDNAYVMADSAMISSRIPGTVQDILVENDTAIKEGQTLIILDPRDYQLAVDEAQAALTRIEAELKGMGLSVSQSDIQTSAQQDSAQSGVGEAQDRVTEGEHKLEALKQQRIAAQADLTIARRDFERYDRLLKQQAIAQQQWDRAKTLLDKSTAPTGRHRCGNQRRRGVRRRRPPGRSTEPCSMDFCQGRTLQRQYPAAAVCRPPGQACRGFRPVAGSSSAPVLLQHHGAD